MSMLPMPALACRGVTPSMRGRLADAPVCVGVCKEKVLSVSVGVGLSVCVNGWKRCIRSRC